MSNGENHSEDLTILAALEALDQGGDAPGGPRGDETAETLTRLYTEVLGLLPYEVEPVAPPPGAKERLLAAIQGDETQPAAPEPAPPVRPAAPVTPLRSSQEVRTAPRPVPPPRAVSRWPLALAATLALMFLGLSLWLLTQVGRQRETIAELNRELAAERGRLQEAMAEVRRTRADAQAMTEKFAVVTSPAVQVSPIRPMGEPPLQPGAHGMLFVAADHQHWYITVRGLQPAAPGQVYKLWFVTPQGPVGADHFNAQPGARVELTSGQMPANTQDVVITLERDPNAVAPAGPPVLKAGTPFTVS